MGALAAEVPRAAAPPALEAKGAHAAQSQRRGGGRRLDPGAIFYLRSRGLSTDAAKLLLTGAFCNTVLDTLPLEALRTHLDAWLASALVEDVPS